MGVYSGIGTATNTKLPTWASSDLTERSIARLKSAAQLVVNPHEYLGRAIYFAGEWDTKITWAIERILGTGDTFIALIATPSR